jgi:cytoskeletal protein CcmA (bactofilin family)
MALFNKEPEKASPKIQPVQPANTANATPSPSAAMAAPSPAPAPRPAVAAPADGRAYLDRGSKISGKLMFDGPARIDGEVDGEIISKDSLNIGESAVVTAQIKAASIVVAGKVSGDITGSQKIEIRPSAKVMGNLAAPLLVIQEGALFEGHCSMQPEVARDDRKVTVFPKEERVAPKEERAPIKDERVAAAPAAQAASSGGQKPA